MDGPERRKALEAMKAKADAVLAKKQKFAEFRLTQDVNAAKSRAMADIVLRSLVDPSAPSVARHTNRPGEKLARGKTKGMKRTGRTSGPSM